VPTSGSQVKTRNEYVLDKSSKMQEDNQTIRRESPRGACQQYFEVNVPCTYVGGKRNDTKLQKFFDRCDSALDLFAILTALATKTGDTTYDNDDLDDAIIFVRFLRSFVRFFVRPRMLHKIDRVAAMISIHKLSKSELSSRFYGCLKIFVFFFS